MSFEGFLRLIWTEVVGAGVTIAIVFLVFHYYFKWSKPSDETRVWSVRLRTILTLCLVFGLAIFVVVTASLNLLPRQTIDRSSLDRQNQQWEQQHISPTP